MTTLTAPRPLAVKAPPRYDALELVNMGCAAIDRKYTEVFASSPTGNLTISEHQTRRMLFGVVIRLGQHFGCPVSVIALSEATGMERGSIHRILRDEVDPGIPTISIGQIMTATCNEIGIEQSELASHTRHVTEVWARRIVTMLARQYTRSSFPHIALRMGRPNHSTVITGRDVAAQRLKLPHGHPLRSVDGRDAADIIAAVKKRLGISESETHTSKQQECAA